MNETLELLAPALTLSHLRMRARENEELHQKRQKQREKKFGRHLTENTICGIRCYPELVFEAVPLPTMMERVRHYNERVEKYTENINCSLSVKQFKKIMRELFVE